MILDEIRIINFRQYYGEQIVKFSKNSEKNVTVIHGENGEGKTAFLNLIRWCLYEKIEMPEPDKLLNERAEAEMDEGSTQRVSVTILFSDKNIQYSVIRTVKYEKNNGKVHNINNDLVVSYIDEEGIWKNLKNPQNTINQILPDSMESYFFFQGEKIRRLSEKDGAGDIRQAIKNIMGIEVIENTAESLEKAYKTLLKEFSALSNSEEAKKSNEKLEAKEREISIEMLKKLEYERNKKASVEEKDKIYEKLRNLEGAKELQKQRDTLEAQKNNLNTKIQEANSDIQKLCSSKGYLAFCTDIIDKVGDILELKREKGEIPAGIKEQFVDDLLERKICICGRELPLGSSEHAHVESWKKKSGNKKIEDVFIQMSADIKGIKVEQEGLFTELERLKKYKKELTDQRKGIIEELEEVSSRLDNKDSESIKELENRRKEVDDQISELDSRIGEAKYIIDGLLKEKAEIKQKLDSITAVEEKAKLAKRRYGVTEQSAKALKVILDITTNNVREKLQDRINDVYNRFSRKGYKAILNDGFELKIVKEYDERIVPLSDGEAQITSLCFIGALVDVAREKSEKENSQFIRGGIFPIVMDSPFGELDGDHKIRITQGMPTLSQQVIIMVRNDQWEGSVEQNIRHRVGKEYILENFNPKKNPEVKFEYTLIKEV